MNMKYKEVPFEERIANEKKEDRKFDCDEALKASRNLYMANKQDTDCLFVYEIIYFKYIGNHAKCSELALEKLQALTNPACIKELYPLLLHELRYFKNNEYAIRLMEILSENKDYTLLVYNDLREFYSKESDTNNIIKYCKLILEVGYCETDVYEQLAKCYDEKEMYEDSFKYYVKAGQNNHSIREYHWVNAGRALILAGKAEEAIFYFKMAVILNPEEQYAHYYLGQFYQTKDDLYGAMYHYTEAVKYTPCYKEDAGNECLFNLNDVLNKKDQISHVENSLLANEDIRFLPILYLTLIKLYRNTNDLEHCEFYQQKFIDSMGLHFQDLQRE